VVNIIEHNRVIGDQILIPPQPEQERVGGGSA
jgi:hypothetical protein